MGPITLLALICVTAQDCSPYIIQNVPIMLRALSIGVEHINPDIQIRAPS